VLVKKPVNIVSGVLLKKQSVLLGLRKNTKDYPGYWALPVGHVEEGENVIDALRRELFEEIGVQMLDCENITTLIDNENNIRHSVFKVTRWRGEAQNLEPQLCQQIEWFELERLPQPLTPATQKLLKTVLFED